MIIQDTESMIWQIYKDINQDLNHYIPFDYQKMLFYESIILSN
jgi:hypothetical protein